MLNRPKQTERRKSARRLPRARNRLVTADSTTQQEFTVQPSQIKARPRCLVGLSATSKAETAWFVQPFFEDFLGARQAVKGFSRGRFLTYPHFTRYNRRPPS